MILFSVCSSPASKKRKFPSVPESNNEWNKDYLSWLKIEFKPLEYNSAALDRYFWSDTALTLSDRAKEFLRRLEPLSVEAILLRRFPDDPTAFLMHKYAALLVSRGVDYDFYFNESTIGAFLVHLLSLLGFVDGPLVVLSKNSLKITINKVEKLFTTADVTVLNLNSGFRLVIAESKTDYEGHESLERFEPQLMAAAIAAGQANLKAERIDQRYKQHKRIKSAPSQDPVSGEVQTSSNALPRLSLFCILVLGTKFLFYRANLQSEFLDGVADYEKLPEKGIPTEVFKIFSTRQETGAYIPSFDFCTAPDRAIIVEILDRMQQMIR
jgi:hypothetical protein